jgi:lysophospholipase L1-like esterase
MTLDAPPAAEIRILALGDSYTIGEGVRSDERWPVRLTALLRARGVRVADPTIVARTGWTTDDLSRGIDDAHPAGVYDIVTLLIGVNDQYRGRSADDYTTRFRELLARAIRFAGGHASRVIVISIPDWGVTPFAVNRDRGRITAEIDRYNAINRAEAARAGARYVDVTPASRLASGDNSLLAEDGLHPSGTMYDDWVELIAPIVASIVSPGHG